MLAFVLVLLCAVSAAASPLGGDEAKALYEQAMTYYYGGQRDDEKALALLTQAAELGSPEAMAKIGDMYYWGRGVSVDPAKSTDRIFEINFLLEPALYKQVAEGRPK